MHPEDPLRPADIGCDDPLLERLYAAHKEPRYDIQQGTDRRAKDRRGRATADAVRQEDVRGGQAQAAGAKDFDLFSVTFLRGILRNRQYED